MDAEMNSITTLVASFLGITPEQLAAHIAAKQETARRRVANANARYAQALARMTDVQSVVIDKMEADGHALQERIWQDRTSGNIAVMLTKKVFGRQSKLVTRLTMVYPDGSRVTTTEKKISLKRSF